MAADASEWNAALHLPGYARRMEGAAATVDHGLHEHGPDCAHGDPATGVRPSWVQPAIVGGLALAACVLLNLRDPNEEGSWGFCPFKVATGGLDCPGCGLLRGTRSLTRGDVLGALDHNILIFPILGMIAYGFYRWAAPTIGLRAPRWTPGVRWIVAAGIALVVFWVVRNLPAFPYLDSGLS